MVFLFRDHPHSRQLPVRGGGFLRSAAEPKADRLGQPPGPPPAELAFQRSRSLPDTSGRRPWPAPRFGFFRTYASCRKERHGSSHGWRVPWKKSPSTLDTSRVGFVYFRDVWIGFRSSRFRDSFSARSLGNWVFGLVVGGLFGAVAQLGERCVRNAEVGGSTPLRSTLPHTSRCHPLTAACCVYRPRRADKSKIVDCCLSQPVLPFAGILSAFRHRRLLPHAE
ncbi:MAG: hypothetical protein RLY70_3199 [Planctomycetota bacterium]